MIAQNRDVPTSRVGASELCAPAPSRGGLKGPSQGPFPAKTPGLRVALALALALSLAFAPTRQARGADASDARRHAQRASNLAASGKCKQAIAEFDKAMAILRDPALLFNRAECYRKIGDTAAALDDYKQFLADLPQAPNRTDVEKRIAELSRKVPSPTAATPVPPPLAAPREVAVRPPAPEAVRPRREPSQSPSPVAPAPVQARVAPNDLTLALPAPVPSPEATANPALALGAPADTSATSSFSSEGGLATRPWFWITVAAVVVAAGVGTFVLLSQDGTTVPSSALGNYKF